MKTLTQTIYVNDRPQELEAGQNLLGLVRELGLAERNGVAVAVNSSVVPRAEWPARALNAEDRILVIQATQGG